MKNPPLVLFLLSFFLLTACDSSKNTESASNTDTTANKAIQQANEVTVEELWESDSGLITPESVLYDKSRDVIYVANINGDSGEKDGNGFISKLSTEGEILELKWVTGMDAPKGMGLHENNLYVSDISKVIEIDVENGEITNSYEVEGAQFLNDIAVDNSGKVFISDSNTNTLYTLENGTVTTWIEAGKLNGPNGLWIEDGNAILASMGSSDVQSIDLNSGEMTSIAKDIGAGDGIVPAGDGYLVSNWHGEVYYIHQDGEVTKLLDTKADSINAADIDFIADEKVLLVPTFFDNRVVAYKVIM